ncbi:CRISPR-associated protein, Csd1-type [Syntrophomonas zehnderi OL-4]|uniref:CRISPR-associated protein, Csd1-type n=1 Tax=Syntrophomonas zehnderi OL-4 TaxID=690567 RepID=A0A0E4GB03_9FIRM|nr:type I-C CRISPR-associated protein Cas8c/Csd1 [Syntrophomonas zehnderi]CFX74515.1 CRISPR-associated protein, Csd1-type [Syntrophomonas zehnderi OL-4]
MILQALTEYYDRKVADPDSKIAPEGFEKIELQFLIVINKNGEFINIEDTREKIGNRMTAKSFLLPRSKVRTGIKSYETTFLLWDHIGYLLGLPKDDSKSSKQHQTWINSLKKLPSELLDDIGVKAVIRFYENNEVIKAVNSPQIQECLKSTQCNMSFRLESDIPVPCRTKVKEFVRNNPNYIVGKENNENNAEDSKTGICLVTGESGVIARTHGRTPIDKDTKCLVGFQRNSGYDSYGKEQGYNAPIVRSTEFAYVTALNTLLKSKNQRMSIGNTATIFWSEKRSSFESDFSFFFKEPEKDNPDAGTQKVKALFNSVNTGTYIEDDGDNRFYILGLAPNAARISIRFWQVGTISEFALRIAQYFNDFKIIKPPNEPEYYSLWRILVNIATQDKSENIPPNLAGDFMRSILEGTPYPATVLQACLRRIHSDTKYRVKPVRAALLKAYLNRYYQFYPNQNHKEVNIELDTKQPSVGYQLGRLFATLEKIQEEANPGINATIRERFYGAACATPVTVFTNLLRLKNHHLAKLENKGRVVNFERLLGEIMSRLTDFPAHLDLHEQGRFAIGYYHQRQSFFTSQKTDSDNNFENN